MKKLFFPLIAIVMALLGYFSHSFLAKENPLAHQEAAQSAQERLISQCITHTFEQMRYDVQRAITGINSDLSNDREFILTYFVEKAIASRGVKMVTQKYADLLDLEYLTLQDKSAGAISTAGTLPQIKKELPYDSLLLIIDENKRAYIIYQNRLESGEGTLSLQGGVVLDKPFITHLSKITGTTILLTYNEEVILGTNSIQIKTIGNINNEYIVINGEKKRALFTPLNGKITLISIFNKDSVSRL